MADETNVGEEATAAGLPLVPNTGEAGKVKYGAKEINRTRDMIARKSRMGTTDPPATLGSDGDIYYKIVG